MDIEVPELQKKVPVSIGLIITLIIATGFITTGYLRLTSLEDRVNKRYDRHEAEISELRTFVDNYMQKHIESLEKENIELKKELEDYRQQLLERAASK